MRNKQGFTLVELMVTIGIIAILSAIAVPNYITHRNNQQVTRGARAVYSALQSAKMMAIRDNTNIDILFSPGIGSAGTYLVFADLNGNGAFDGGEERSDGEMPPGITLANANFSGDALATFNGMGMPRHPNGALDWGTVQVRNNARCNRITINTSGNIRIDQCP